MYPSSEYNPNAPRIAGTKGLFFGIGTADKWDSDSPSRVIVGLAPNEWGYMGQYNMLPRLSLTKEEWNAQSPAVSAQTLQFMHTNIVKSSKPLGLPEFSIILGDDALEHVSLFKNP